MFSGGVGDHTLGDGAPREQHKGDAATWVRPTPDEVEAAQLARAQGRAHKG
jgi:hypothetical protein